MEIIKKKILRATKIEETENNKFIIVPDTSVNYNVKFLLSSEVRDLGFFDLRIDPYIETRLPVYTTTKSINFTGGKEIEKYEYVDTYGMQYRRKNTTNWITVISPLSLDGIRLKINTYAQIIDGLNSDTLYEFRAYMKMKEDSDYFGAEYFGQIEEARTLIPIPTYELKLIVTGSGGGLVNIDGSGNYRHGTYYISINEDTTISLQVVDSHGWVFDKWKKDLSGSARQQDLLMNNNMEVEAVFEEEMEEMVTLTFNSNAGGYLCWEGNSYVFKEIVVPKGSIVDLSACEDLNYVFDYWSGDKTSANKDISINMNEDKEVFANFQLFRFGQDKWEGWEGVDVDAGNVVQKVEEIQYNKAALWNDVNNEWNYISPVSVDQPIEIPFSRTYFVVNYGYEFYFQGNTPFGWVNAEIDLYVFIEHYTGASTNRIVNNISDINTNDNVYILKNNKWHAYWYQDYHNIDNQLSGYATIFNVNAGEKFRIRALLKIENKQSMSTLQIEYAYIRDFNFTGGGDHNTLEYPLKITSY